MSTPRIVSGADCLDAHVEDRRGFVAFPRARSDVFARWLEGEDLRAGLPDLARWFSREPPRPERLVPAWYRRGFFLPPAPPDLSRVEIVLWAGLADEVLRYRDFGGVPLAPTANPILLVPPDLLPRFLREFPDLPPLRPDERAEGHRRADAALCRRGPRARRVLVLYDSSRLHAALRPAYDLAAETMAGTLAPLGWEIHRMLAGTAPHPRDGYWAHYDPDALRAFWRGVTG